MDSPLPPQQELPVTREALLRQGGLDAVKQYVEINQWVRDLIDAANAKDPERYVEVLFRGREVPEGGRQRTLELTREWLK